MKDIGDGFRLSTGTEIYANKSILGLSPTDSAIFEGYDGCVYDPDESDPMQKLSPAECAEIAEYMIELWQKWKSEHGEK